MAYLSLSCSDSQEKAKLTCLCVLTTAGWTLLNILQTLRESIQEVSSVYTVHLPYSVVVNIEDLYQMVV